MFKELLDYYSKNGQSPTRREIPYSERYIKIYGSWNKTLEAAGLPIRRKIGHTKEELIYSLQQFFHKKGKSPLATDCLKSNGLFDFETYRKVLGCKKWSEVLLKAGLQPYQERSDATLLDDATLLNLLTAFFNKTDNKTRIYYNRHKKDLPSSSYLVSRFESWDNVLRMSGQEIDRNELKKEDVVLAFLKAKSFYGRVPSTSEFEEFTGISCRILYKFTGPYNTFLQEMNETPINNSPSKIEETDDELKKLYIDFSFKHGFENGAPCHILDSSPEIYNSDVFIIRFTSMFNLRRACGFVNNKSTKEQYSKKEIRDFIKLTYQRFGRIPSVKELKSIPDSPSISSLLRYTQSKGILEAFRKVITTL